ncbi:MAG: hypothetical protein CMK92_06265 [Pseudomonas sp.]|nr:hypothetical protein [Pseudomonas sp.]|tara:strand:- start:101 stop:610 length:510 start_codon:yes stop_codon:yes gene_type:complete
MIVSQKQIKNLIIYFFIVLFSRFSQAYEPFYKYESKIHDFERILNIDIDNVPGMTNEQYEAIETYVSYTEQYKEINGYLRGLYKPETNEKKKAIEEIISHLDSSINLYKIPQLAKPHMLVRGERNKLFWDGSPYYKGQEIKDKAFKSTSLSIEAAKNFAGYDGSILYIF